MNITTNEKYVINKYSIAEPDMKMLLLLLEGNTCKQAGKKVFKSGRTVEGHMFKLRRKFKDDTNIHLMAILISRKIITIK